MSALAAGETLIAFEEIASVCASVGESLRRHPIKPTGDVTVLSGDDAVEAAAPAWSALETAGALSTPFQSFAVARTTSRVHLKRGDKPYIAIVREAGRPVALLPAVATRRFGISVLCFLGDPLIQYGDALAAPEARFHHLQAAWDALAGTGAASVALLRKVRADAHIERLLAQAARRTKSDEAPFVDLARLDPLPATRSRKLGRYRRRLAELGEIQFEVKRGQDARLLLQTAIAVKRAWLMERALMSRVIGDADWESALLSLATADEKSHFAAATLSVGEKLAAVEIGLISGGRWYAFLGVTAPAFAKAGPGHLQIAETIAYCRNAGFTIYDLLAPAENYKRGWASGGVAVSDYAAALDFRGHAALWSLQLLPRAKRTLNALPPSLRRLLVRQMG
ncbi:MAG TPA: GNAT family N-acetyltransferase [Xanthobacteraceae bacterium]|nr:GNAT family N-acetyltransferase [Xanthobacteraceae bacterium]